MSSVPAPPATAVRRVVSDDGAGIEPSELARIWEPYVTHKPGGTGLGLAIVDAIIAAHGGTVQVSNQPYNGPLSTGGSTSFGFQGTGSSSGLDELHRRQPAACGAGSLAQQTASCSAPSQISRAWA